MRSSISATLTALALFCSVAASAQTDIIISEPTGGSRIIPKEIYGQFAEHLGSCIYGGIWVGKDSPIPNQDGYRSDVLEALKALQIPVLRWPGGCFADDYHWMDGVGPQENRPTISNGNWGGTLEDNSFGTHEFLNLCELLGCEAYVCGNVGSGSVEELAKWVEYMTSDSQSSVAEMRRRNGRDKPWKVRYLGIGNEAWGCGGNMPADYYSLLYRRYTTYIREWDGNELYLIASGANSYDTAWTEILLKNIGDKADGMGVHYYAVPNWSAKGSATDFSEREYARLLAKAVDIEDVIQEHIKVMDRLDPERKVDLLIDEWGTWYEVEPGTNPGHLFQQNTMRDAMVAALSLNVFHKYTDRIKMTNIAQMVNVLQAMILTDTTGRMVLTPTYHVYEMYRIFQDAEALDVQNDYPLQVVGNDSYPGLSVTAARKDGKLMIALVNTGLKKDIAVRIDAGSVVEELSPSSQIKARILTCNDIRDHNTFDNAHQVEPQNFYSFKKRDGRLELSVPARSIITLEI